MNIYRQFVLWTETLTTNIKKSINNSNRGLVGKSELHYGKRLHHQRKSAHAQST